MTLLAVLLSVLSAVPAPAAPKGYDVLSEGARLHRLEEDKGAILYRRSDDAGRSWTRPVRVDKGRPAAYHFGAGDVRLAADGGALLAIWSATGDGPHDSGPLVVARSTDAGRSWTAAASPAGEGRAGRRYPALAGGGGRFVAAWIDRASNAKLLASVTEDAGATWSAPAVIDGDMCECCWNAAHASGGRVSVLFRDKDPRDMKVATSADGGRTWATKPAGPQGWAFNGCPHVGGALAGGDTLHALTWTGSEAEMGLHVGPVGGKQSRLGGPGAKHADLASSGPRLAAVWNEGGAAWAASSPDGASWSEPQRLSGAKSKAAYPRVVAAGGAFRAFWLEKEGEGPARLRETALP
jgi:hypothetical protein